MHDFFDVIGLPENAPLGEIRRSVRRPRRHHPDFRLTPPDPAPRSIDEWVPDGRVAREVAVDFVDVGTLLDRIEARFFGRDR